MSNLLVSLQELGETTLTQRDYALRIPVAVRSPDNLIIAHARYVKWAAVTAAMVGGPMYEMISAGLWAGVVTQDYNLSGVLGSGLGIVGAQAAGADITNNPAAAALLAVRAAGYGWCQTWGDNAVALSVKTAIVAGAPMVGSTVDGFWDDIAGTVLTSSSGTAYNMGYGGVAGNFRITVASSLVAVAIGQAMIRTVHAGGVGL